MKKLPTSLVRFNIPVERYMVKDGFHHHNGMPLRIIWDNIAQSLVLIPQNKSTKQYVDELNEDYNLYLNELHECLRGKY